MEPGLRSLTNRAEKFEYEEEVQFRHVGKPFLAYSQRTWAANETKAPMHTGILKKYGHKFV